MVENGQETSKLWLF